MSTLMANEKLTHLKERIANTGNIMLWRVTSHDEILQDTNQLWYSLKQIHYIHGMTKNLKTFLLENR